MRIYIFMILLWASFSNAAGFDCSKAKSQQEKLICSNTELSELDSTLSYLYKAGKTNIPNLVKSQIMWVKERDKCANAQCLKTSYMNRIAFIVDQKQCTTKINNLVGTWIKISGNTTFEEMEFGKKQNELYFSSWLHHQPESFGNWSISNCKISVINRDQPALNSDLSIINFESNTLTVQEDNAEIGKYRLKNIKE